MVAMVFDFLTSSFDIDALVFLFILSVVTLLVTAVLLFTGGFFAMLLLGCPGLVFFGVVLATGYY